LAQPKEGKVLYSDVALEAIDKQLFHRQMGFVFQDSVIFNMTVRENISFAEDITQDDLQKAASLGADRYLVKSAFKPEQLLDVVAELLEP